MIAPLIYIVDDEPDILELYSNLLGQEYRVLCFESPNDFLQALQNEAPSLVITDLKMPQMDGLAMIRQAQLEGYDFPFILLTGYLDKEKTLEAMEVGVSRVLEKPTDYNLLLSIIDQLFIEKEISNVRSEVQSLMSQLREIYTSLRIIMGQYIPQEVLDRSIIETDSTGKVKQKQNFEHILDRLESRLHYLLDTEKKLTAMKKAQAKT